MTETKHIVISAVNFTTSGPLKVLNDFVDGILDKHPDYRVTTLLHDSSLLEQEGVEKVVFRYPKKSWFLRIFFEWVHLFFWSRKHDIDLWVSLHDITPIVKARKQVVYCHNPMPFMNYDFDVIRNEPRLLFYRIFYGFIYRSFLKRNSLIIVQQHWLKKEFERRYNAKNIVVAYPKHRRTFESATMPLSTSKKHYVYPAVPRGFKNFDIICGAAKILQTEFGSLVKFVITIDGTENRYARRLLKEYGNLSNLIFSGFVDSKEMAELYREAKGLIFPSKLETWGLPISEAKTYDIPIFIASERYAHEAIGNYDKVSFFDPNDARQLAEMILSHELGELEFTANKQDFYKDVVAENYDELIGIISNI